MEPSPETSIERDFSTRIDEPPKFELESYISNYSGRTRFNRLYFIGTRSTFLSVEALKQAVREAKEGGKNVRAYERAVAALGRVAPDDLDAKLDGEWVTRTTRAIAAETQRLEAELKGYKNNLIKESIRMGNEDLGHHYQAMGDLAAASKAYTRMREYCTTPSHIASMHLQNTVVCVDRADWLGVQTNVNRLRTMTFRPEDAPRNRARMQAATGLFQLASGAYHDAARSFLATDPALAEADGPGPGAAASFSGGGGSDTPGSFKAVISPNDVAVYGALCALATLTRGELATHVLENRPFRTFLELEPHLRRAVSCLVAGKLRACLDVLDAYRTDYRLDLHLHRHVDALYARIRVKAMQLYIVPYARVTLDEMARVFPPPPPPLPEAVLPHKKHDQQEKGEQQQQPQSLVDELISYVRDGTVNARIDLDRHLLVTAAGDSRANVYETTLRDARKFSDAAHVQVVRVNMLYAGLAVPGVQGHGVGTGGMEGVELERLGGEMGVQMGATAGGQGFRGAKGREAETVNLNRV